MTQGMPPGPPGPGPQGGWIVHQQPVATPPAPIEQRSHAQIYIILTFVFLGVGALIAFGVFTGGEETIEGLMLSIPFFIAALVLGIIGASVAGRDRRMGAETAAATAGAVVGGVGAAMAAVLAIVLVIVAIVALFVRMMMCVMSFGMAC